MGVTRPLPIGLEVETLSAELPCLIDHGRSGEVAAPFTDDGIEGHSTGACSVGRDTNASTHRQRAARGAHSARHPFSDLRLQPPQGRLLEGSNMLTLFAEEAPTPYLVDPMLVADRDDIGVLGEDSRCLCRQRMTTRLFVRQGTAPPLVTGGPSEEHAGSRR